jgi:hypothetical protein
MYADLRVQFPLMHCSFVSTTSITGGFFSHAQDIIARITKNVEKLNEVFVSVNNVLEVCSMKCPCCCVRQLRFLRCDMGERRECSLKIERSTQVLSFWVVVLQEVPQYDSDIERINHVWGNYTRNVNADIASSINRA